METNYSPIQVVLDVRRFQDERVRQPGGSAKDFFVGDDKAFVVHRQRIHSELSSVGSRLVASSAGGIGFIRVRMREEALAKSHRPIDRLFNPLFTPTVGSGGLGEIIVQVSPYTIDRALAEVSKAEDTLAFKPSKTNPEKKVPAPSKWRSEVGAIESLDLWAPTDRRTFSAKSAVGWFAEHAVPRAYRIDLFEAQRPTMRPAQVEFDAMGHLIESFQTTLDEELTCGYVATIHRPDARSMPRMYLWLVANPKSRFIVSSKHIARALEMAGESTMEVTHHQHLLDVLDKQPAVRRVSLPASLEPQAIAAGAMAGADKPHVFSLPQPDASYPVVGVIDGGIATLPSQWRLHTADIVAASHAEQGHGTEIGSLLVDGQSLNGPDVCPEPDGCWLVDLALIPKRQKFEDYYQSEIDLVLQIEREVIEAKAKTKARVFSLSHNVEDPPGGNPTYTELSQGLDRIAREQDVVFVVSAGNTAPGRGRREWTSNQVAVLTNLAAANDDRITAPADSVLSIAVGALNPPSAVASVITEAPARYSRRGPGYKQLVKPDVSHYGGTCASTSPQTGLKTVGLSGLAGFVAGTSYSTPLVAKSVARYDQLTLGALPREALVALLIHSARMPTCMDGYSKSQIARNLVGFGRPVSAQQLIDGAPYAATLLFHDRIMPRKDLFFGFDWPQCLTSDGKCRGDALLTLVYAPPISDAFESELVRVNLEATLQQLDPVKAKYEKQGTDTFAGPDAAMGGAMERELIEDGLKWGIVKQVKFAPTRAVGKSSDWRIWLKYLLRSGEVFPEEGIPFSMVLTISDSKQAAPVYQDMKIGLTSRQVLTSDIRQPAGRVQVQK